jgi:hypothetical protein
MSVQTITIEIDQLTAEKLQAQADAQGLTLDALLRSITELWDCTHKKSFYETASPEERARAVEEWATSTAYPPRHCPTKQSAVIAFTGNEKTISYKLSKCPVRKARRCARAGERDIAMENMQTSPSVNAILTAMRQMPIAELEQLVDQVIAIRAERVAPHLNADESASLARINQSLPAEDRNRMRAHRKARRRDDHGRRMAGIGGAD